MDICVCSRNVEYLNILISINSHEIYQSQWTNIDKTALNIVRKLFFNQQKFWIKLTPFIIFVKSCCCNSTRHII